MPLRLAALLAQDALEALAYLIRHRDPEGVWERAPVGEGQLKADCETGTWKGSIRHTAAVAGALLAGRGRPCRSVFGEK